MMDAERYAITVRKVTVEGDELWRATVRELPDVAEFAETRDEAIDLILDTIETLKQVAAEEGREFPAPIEDDEEFSGRVTLRMPKTLHRLVAQWADDEGTSLNSYITTALAIKLAEQVNAEQRDLASKALRSACARLGSYGTGMDVAVLDAYPYVQQAVTAPEIGHGFSSTIISIVDDDDTATITSSSYGLCTGGNVPALPIFNPEPRAESRARRRS